MNGSHSDSLQINARLNILILWLSCIYEWTRNEEWQEIFVTNVWCWLLVLYFLPHHLWKHLMEDVIFTAQQIYFVTQMCNYQLPFQFWHFNPLSRKFIKIFFKAYISRIVFFTIFFNYCLLATSIFILFYWDSSNLNTN